MWIEIFTYRRVNLNTNVTPHAGVWIEIKERIQEDTEPILITPHAGVWIEIDWKIYFGATKTVTPHAGV